jgi:hypothetical protein
MLIPVGPLQTQMWALNTSSIGPNVVPDADFIDSLVQVGGKRANVLRHGYHIVVPLVEL